MFKDYDPSKVTPYGEAYVVGDMIMHFYYDENHEVKAIYVTDIEGAERDVKLLKEGIERAKRFQKKNSKTIKFESLT